ncbi:carbohydrate ABC transporter permease [Actinosynnema sp. CS-041913]|uniref:carbohydrate ABC transporter permease n=1 Tax=Actinosynnema sp. CS-041913 TaxID=3239917 RepID=UPI003D8AD306
MREAPAGPVVYAGLVVVAALVLLPLGWTVLASLTPEAQIARFPPRVLPEDITFEHYREIWRQLPLARQFLNTLVFAGGVTVLSLLFDSMAAYALARLDFPGKRLVFGLVLALLMIPPQVTLVPLYELMSDLDWINTYHGLILPRAGSAFGIFFLRQFFLTIPRDLDDAARIDGASHLRIYARIMVPVSAPAVLTLGLFHFMYNWNDLLWPLVFTTDRSMHTLPAGLALFMGKHVVQYGLLMAGAVLTLVPVVLAFVLVQRRFVEGIATTGMR